jgi:PAS fold
VLRTPLTVARDSPLLVIDRALDVSAVSARAEELLGIAEPRAVGQPIGELLVASEQPEQLTASLRDAVLGGGASLSLRCTTSPETLAVRVGPCGPPPGALLLLNPASG